MCFCVELSMTFDLSIWVWSNTKIQFPVREFACSVVQIHIRIRFGGEVSSAGTAVIIILNWSNHKLQSKRATVLQSPWKCTPAHTPFLVNWTLLLLCFEKYSSASEYTAGHWTPLLQQGVMHKFGVWSWQYFKKYRVMHKFVLQHVYCILSLKFSLQLNDSNSVYC